MFFPMAASAYGNLTVKVKPMKLVEICPFLWLSTKKWTIKRVNFNNF